MTPVFKVEMNQDGDGDEDGQWEKGEKAQGYKEEEGNWKAIKSATPTETLHRPTSKEGNRLRKAICWPTNILLKNLPGMVHKTK